MKRKINGIIRDTNEATYMCSIELEEEDVALYKDINGYFIVKTSKTHPDNVRLESIENQLAARITGKYMSTTREDLSNYFPEFDLDDTSKVQKKLYLSNRAVYYLEQLRENLDTTNSHLIERLIIEEFENNINLNHKGEL